MTLKDKLAAIRERHAVLPGETIYPGHAKVDLPALLDALEISLEALEKAPHGDQVVYNADGSINYRQECRKLIYDMASSPCTCWKSQALKAISEKMGVCE